MRIDAYKERSEALLIQYSAIELADMVAQAELQIEALTAERDEFRDAIINRRFLVKDTITGKELTWWRGPENEDEQ